MRIVTAAIVKGGTGKSTSVAALAQAGTVSGRRVLVVDLDPQGNVSMFLGAATDGSGSLELLHGAPLVDVLQHTEQGVDCIAASPDLAAETSRPGSAQRLSRALKQAQDYDLVLIDTPPTLGELLFNALQASSGLIVPVEADSSSLQGLYQIVDVSHQIRQTSNPGLDVLGVVITRFDARPKLHRYLLDVLVQKAKEMGIPLLQVIRSGIAVREAQAMQMNLYTYAPKSKPAKDYATLLERLLEETAT